MGKLAEIKNKATNSSVEEFIAKITNEQKRKDSAILLQLMEKITKEKPKMWGASTVGFGNMIYKSPASGREVEWLKIGFSPRKANLSLFPFDIQSQSNALKKLGKYKAGVGCLYINKLEDVDMKVLEEMVKTAMKGK